MVPKYLIFLIILAKFLSIVSSRGILEIGDENGSSKKEVSSKTNKMVQEKVENSTEIFSDTPRKRISEETEDLENQEGKEKLGSLRLYDLLSSSLDLTFWVKTFLRLLVISSVLNVIGITSLMFFLPVLDFRKKLTDQGYGRSLIDESEEIYELKDFFIFSALSGFSIFN